MIALVSASAETPVGLGQSECDSRFRRWLASDRDVGVIETTHAARDVGPSNRPYSSYAQQLLFVITTAICRHIESAYNNLQANANVLSILLINDIK